jgi:hypothetical protein
VLDAVGQTDLSEPFLGPPTAFADNWGSRLKFWKTNPTRRLRMSASWSRSRPATASPLRRYSPPDGVSRHPRRLRRVDFPEPEGPTTATNSPFLTLISTPRSASTWTLPVS